MDLNKNYEILVETAKGLNIEIKNKEKEFEETLNTKNLELDELKQALKNKEIELKNCKNNLPSKVEKRIPALKEKLELKMARCKKLGNKIGKTYV